MISKESHIVNIYIYPTSKKLTIRYDEKTKYVTKYTTDDNYIARLQLITLFKYFKEGNFDNKHIYL